ncbi:hypothetical protein GCM10023094_25520 [Rhodococcus olei]|uniref:Major facilitator superfamily (MFS) profile domain-containing protein n=1 Tax=Rhodococcus olei TaxID=2161675 RepID=A0ABP8P3V2_9NOCA
MTGGPDRVRHPTLRRLAAGVAAAVVAGAVVGVLARTLMSLTTVVGGGTQGFSSGGTAGILALYAAAMVPGALAAAAGSRLVSRVLLTAGALFLCVPAVGVAGEEVGDLGGTGTVRLLGVAVCGVAVFATLAVLPVVTARLVTRWAGTPVAAATRAPVS